MYRHTHTLSAVQQFIAWQFGVPLIASTIVCVKCCKHGVTMKEKKWVSTSSRGRYSCFLNKTLNLNDNINTVISREGGYYYAATSS